MKNYFIILTLIMFGQNLFSQNQIENKNNKTNVKLDSIKKYVDKFPITEFKNRKNELIYIKEYLNYKLPIILTQQDLPRMIKIQNELNSKGEKVSLEEAARRSLDFKYLYNSYITSIISENTSFKIVKGQLEKKGYLEFNISNKNEKKSKVNENIKQSESNSGNSYGFGENEPYSLFGRTVINKFTPENNCNENGTVIIEIVVDKNGNVTDAKSGRGSTTVSECLINNSKSAALKTKWNIEENAPEKQKGKITYKFKIN